MTHKSDHETRVAGQEEFHCLTNLGKQYVPPNYILFDLQVVDQSSIVFIKFTPLRINEFMYYIKITVKT